LTLSREIIKEPSSEVRGKGFRGGGRNGKAGGGRVKLKGPLGDVVGARRGSNK